MSGVDPNLLARALQKFVGELDDLRHLVVALIERQGSIDRRIDSLYDSLHNEFFPALDQLRVEDQRLWAESRRLGAAGEEVHAALDHACSFLAGHEVVLFEITGKPTEPVLPLPTQEPDQEAPPDRDTLVRRILAKERADCQR